MPTVTYGTHYPWNCSAPGAPADNRPYAEVVLNGPYASPRIWCLVDSGADSIQIDTAFGTTAGVGIGTGTTTTVVTASGGSVTVEEIPNLSLTIEGTALTDSCLFATGGIPILGRVTFLRAFEVGLDKKGWMRT